MCRPSFRHFALQFIVAIFASGSFQRTLAFEKPTLSDFVVACRDESKINFTCYTLSHLRGQANVDYRVNYVLIYM
jgi:hypothetical protein